MAGNIPSGRRGCIRDVYKRQDLKLMFATVKVLFMKESTSGVQDGQVTASAGSAESQLESVDVEMAGMKKASKESA